MFTKLIILSVLFISCSSSPLNNVTVSEQNVTKREIRTGDLFPDWVPFKNKHGDELGEFVQVQKKSKVKKRLAPPVNFILRAVADEGDEYFDQGAGESDSEDYFEKKDWSDVHRPAKEGGVPKVEVNHTDISDIDGVVNIITQPSPSRIAAALESVKKEIDKKKEQRQKKLEGEILEPDDDPTTQPSTEPESSNTTTKANNDEREEEEEEENARKTKLSSAEIKENEERKAKILSSVDKLKERHAEEQRQISDRIKEEDLFRDQITGGSYKGKGRPERWPRKKGKKPTSKPDYDEYEDSNGSSGDKYKINPMKMELPPETETRRPKTTVSVTTYPKVSKLVQAGKPSVFRNPSLYMIEDDDPESTTLKSTAYLSTRSQKFSSRYTTTPASTEDERISLVPVDSKEGEPTLFFPMKRKDRRKRIRATTVSDIDSSVAETVTDSNNYKQTEPYYVTGTDTQLQETTLPDYTDNTGVGTTATDTVTPSYEDVTDVIPAASDHKKEEQHDYENKKGGGREHDSEHSEEHEEHGKKAYEAKWWMADKEYIYTEQGHHEDSKTAKGHHDKEDHLGKYDDHGGVNKHHSEEIGHYGDHHHEEHGKKHAKYEESGKHSKGHSTKGSHDIHKKEEYEKKVEFFEEEGDSGEEEKHGGYNHEREHAEGGHFNNGRSKANHEHQAKGESGHFEKGGHQKYQKGHKEAEGHDTHGKNAHKHFHKEGKDGGRKWIYHHGYPAKTANLVVIDRRADQMYHGPHYYG